MTATAYSFAACLFLTLLSLARPANAQNTTTPPPYGQVSIASPTAASLGKYADIPVNNHTGIPEISVPFYTIQEGSLTMPISLSYHAGGIKVQEPASWVGTSWALNAGGVITRSVVGIPDESGTTNNGVFGHFSDYGYSNYWTTGGNPLFTVSGAAAPNDINFARGQYDGEPDLYFFNFNGYTGKFFFSDDRTPVVVDGQDLKIEYYYPRGTSAAVSGPRSGNIQGFVITVPTGDKYYFGITDTTAPNGASPVETTHSSAEGNTINDNVYSSYYLSKVVAADGVHTIKLTYAAEQYGYYTTSLSPITVTARNGGSLFATDYYHHEYSLVRNNIDGVRLAQISFSNGSVTFNPAASARVDLDEYLYDFVNTKAKALGSISIAAASGSPGSASTFCKQYDFTYSYYGGDTTPLARNMVATQPLSTDESRLRLDQIQEKACDGTVAANAWIFGYEGNFLPRRLSFAQDHWGFYNGQNGNSRLNTLIPTYYADPNNAVPSFTGANREADSVATRKGILTSITYPTGGSSAFVYESNDVWISYRTHSFELAYSKCIGAYCNPDSSEIKFNIAFSGNAYRFTLDYYRSGATGNVYAGRAWFGGASPSLNLSVARNSPLHAEATVIPAPGTRRYTLGADIAVSSGDNALVHVYEDKFRQVTENVLAGGLRIKSVTSRPNSVAPSITTRYTYRDGNGQSTATLYSRPRYVQVIRNDELAKYNFWYGYNSQGPDLYSYYKRSPKGCLCPLLSTVNDYLVSPCGILPLSTTQGNHLGYDQVTVSQPGNGRTDYYYYSAVPWLKNNHNDVCYRNVDPSVCDPTSPSMPVVPLPYDFSRGQLKYQRVFDGQGQLLKDIQYSYAYDSSKVVTPAYMVKYVGDAMFGNTYTRKSYWKTQTKVIENNLSAGQSWQSTIISTYASPYHREVVQTTQILPSGDTLITNNKYSFDFRVAACDSISDGTSLYMARCRACDAALNQQLQTANDLDQAHKYAIDNGLCRANARKSYISYRRTYLTDRSNVFQTRHDAARDAADTHLKPLLQLQDSYTNKPVETSHWKNHRLLDANYTTFGPSLSRPNIWYPFQQFNLFLTSPSATFAPASVTGNGISLDGRYATLPEATFSFDFGTLVQVIPKTGIVTSYLWGYGNTLPIAKAVGVRYTTLQAAYANSGSDLTALRRVPSLARAGVLLTTYTHRPLVGMLSQTDPTGRLVTYEYDVLGRLVRTRDEQGHILSQQQYHYTGQ
jgi:YD repeat-containing protein